MHGILFVAKKNYSSRQHMIFLFVLFFRENKADISCESFLAADSHEPFSLLSLKINRKKNLLN